MQNYLQVVISKLIVENAKDLSESEIKRCFSGCVMPLKLAKLANNFVLSGEITPEMLNHD